VAYPPRRSPRLFQATFRAFHLAEGAIAGLSTLDRKADETGLLEFCADRELPLKFFSAEQLQRVPIPTPSQSVAAVVNTPSVAEAAASLGAESGYLRIAKRIFRPDDRAKAVTIAIAQAEEEYRNTSL
jgi:cobalt-precorrin 5A hydrolase/precorrin-3B C17-methyltransferase